MRNYDELVQLCYECVLDESRWNVLLERLIPLSGRQQGGVMIRVENTDRVAVSEYHRYAEEVIPPYLAYYNQLDPGRRVMPQRPAGLWYHDLQHLGAEEIRRNPYYQEYQHPFGLGYLSCVKLHETANTSAYLSLITASDARYPTNNQQKLLERLSPHLRLAGTLSTRLRDLSLQLNLESFVLWQSHCTFWLVNDRSRLIFASRRAEACLKERGFPLQETQGRLRASQLDSSLNTAIQRAVGRQGAAQASLIRLPGKRRRDLLVVPMLNHSITQSPLVLLSLSELQPKLELLVDIFHFTNAECRIAVLLLEGLTPEACAEHLNVSINTIRTHLRALLRKTDTERQTELVAVLGRLVAS
ncbi:helix-turn-helix transcriptional regulator [Azomonas macrocytogenes]|uniref:DNA-binding CsgD family transcriptional regulator n=1 Tax=Azomonas macrocytogenes TaxID=69962 RepID=A0A839T742_AZOMA|nr:helix-turn-helix transcriptional regulator [Azomonas macrocytogenes]MBB3103775.1 DNA-binding CsgD family transcriptional regulator [Azomonas macrocytogenes]